MRNIFSPNLSPIRREILIMEEIKMPIYLKYNKLRHLDIIGLSLLCASVVFLYENILWLKIIGVLSMMASINLFFFGAVIKLKDGEKKVLPNLRNNAIIGIILSELVLLIDVCDVNKYVCLVLLVCIYFITIFRPLDKHEN